jgi:hypothetical protein
MKVEINCTGSRSVPLHKLRPFQGNLKELSEANFIKLKGLITTMGFSFPVFVWQDPDGGHEYLLDGHQRVRTLTEMKKEGFEIPDIPVADVEADSFSNAKKKLLAAASQFGSFQSQGLYEFISENKFDVDGISENFTMPEIDMGKFKTEFYDGPPEPKPPKEQKEKLDTEHECPQCGYKW